MNEQLRALPTSRATTVHPTTEGDPLDDRPKSVYEIITRQMLNDLRADLDEIKGRVNALLWLTVGAVLVDIVMRIAN